jgi:hypothetical protein
MKNNPIRGFQNLIGETIKKIDATSINSVTVLCESGKVVEIDGDETHYRIAILQANVTKG